MLTQPPRDERELLERAWGLAGRTLHELAAELGDAVPSRRRSAKGWAGQLLEQALGATAGPRAEPDFQLIGVELKTIPVNVRGEPRESTYVCTVPLVSPAPPTWAHSAVRRKLARVLWIPVQVDSELDIGRRRIGSPLLWSPDPEEEAVLRADWEDLMDMVCLGQVEAITAHQGTWLQIRPKAANARARRWGVGETGERIRTLPRGFYLRSGFTSALLRRHYVIRGGP